MKKKNKSGKYFTSRNFIYLLISIVVIVLLIWYVISWYNVKQKEKYMNSYLIDTNTLTYKINDLTEVSQVLNEAPSKYFIYISYTNDKEVFKLEKNLKKIIDEYSLKDEFYFLDITNIKNDDDLLIKLNDSLNTTRIKTTPALLYYVDGKLEDVIQLKGSVFDTKELITLLKNYEYEKISQ